MLKRLKIFSVIALVLSLILPICVSAYQDETDLPSGITESPISEAPLYVDYSSRDMIPVEALANAELSPQDIPEALRVRNADTSKYAHRVYNLEDEYSLVYQNSDGTNTMLQFTEPIQYRDSDGNLKDISTAMSLVGKDYVMLDNDVFVKIPNNLSDGVKFEIDGLKLSMKPFGALADIGSVSKLTDSAEKLSASTSKYSYSGIYGSDTAIVYSPLFDGVKCDIILQQYIDKNEFEFEVELNGFSLEKDENEKIIYILDSSGERVAFFGTVMSYDAMGNVSFGDMNFKELGDDKYLVILSVDEEFLTDPDTVYPVTVDPTVKSFVHHDGTGVFEYLCIYSDGTSLHNLSYSTADMLVGSSEHGKGRILYKFRHTKWPIKELTKVEIRQCVRSSSYPTDTMYAYPFLGNDWSITSSYNNVGANNYDISNPISVSYSDYGINAKTATIDITSFLLNIDSNAHANYSEEKGIILVNSDGEVAPEYIVYTSNIPIANANITATPELACFSPYAVMTYEPYKIMLDPGHFYGYNPISYTYNGEDFVYSEGTQMWKLHEYLKTDLVRKGLAVNVTRSIKTENTPVDPDVTGNRGAKAQDHDLFISLHSNATDDSTTNRIVVIYDIYNKNNASVFADILGNSARNAMNDGGLSISSVQIWQRPLTTKENGNVIAYDEKGLMQNYYAVLRAAAATNCPLYYIIEHSFHTNLASAAWLNIDANLESLAVYEAEAIVNYLKGSTAN